MKKRRDVPSKLLFLFFLIVLAFLVVFFFKGVLWDGSLVGDVQRVDSLSNKFSGLRAAEKGTAALEAQGGVAIENAQNTQDVVYALALETRNWQVKKARRYTQSSEVTRRIREFTSQVVGSEQQLYRAILTVNGQEDIQHFSSVEVAITEDFREDGTIHLESIEDLPKEEVEVRFILARQLPLGQIRLRIISPQGVTLADRQLNVASIGGREYLEQVVPAQPQSSSPNLAGSGVPAFTGRTVVSDGRQIPVTGNSDEGEIFNRECGGLREVFPRHNRLGENRINIVFAGLGFSRNAQNRPSFVQYLLRIVDYSGISPDIPGLFSTPPFEYNEHLFNFWYLDRDFVLEERRGDYSKRCDRQNPFSPCLSNTQVIYLVNDLCRSVAIGDRWWAFAVGGKSRAWLSVDNEGSLLEKRFLHEFSHSFGNLADEYTEPEKGSRPRYPNCLDPENPRIRSWPGVFYGCSYTNELVKPTESSIMNDYIDFGGYQFGQVNELHLCNRMISMTGQLPQGICSGVFHGRGGYSCASDAECISNICDYPPGIRTKQCFSALATDKICSIDRQCPSNLCRPMGRDSKKWCLRDSLRRGEICYYPEQCMSGLFCIGRSCGEKKENGWICDSDEQCLSNLCKQTPGANYRECLARGLQAGTSCLYHEQCLSGNCVQVVGGRACLAETGSLQNGVSCTTNSECSSRLCRYPRGSRSLTCLPSNLPAGSRCDLSIQCQSFNCDEENFTCLSHARTNLADGSLCNVDSDCQSGACIQYQTRRICGNSNLANGNICARSTQCRSGYCALTPGGRLCSICSTNLQCGTNKICENGVCW